MRENRPARLQQGSIRGCRPPQGQQATVFAMKFRSHALYQADLYHQALPDASCLFLYRDALGFTLFVDQGGYAYLERERVGLRLLALDAGSRNPPLRPRTPRSSWIASAPARWTISGWSAGRPLAA